MSNLCTPLGGGLPQKNLRGENFFHIVYYVLLYCIAYCTTLLWYYHTWWNKEYHNSKTRIFGV